MIDIDKMNDCSKAAQKSGNARFIMDKTFEAISDFSDSHMTDAAGELIKEAGTKFDRGKIINLFIEDMHKKIFVRETK